MKMHKIFQVIIDDNIYDVFDIKDKEHEGYNNTPKTWWIYYSKARIREKTLSIDSSCFIPFTSSVPRLTWDIRFVQKTYTKNEKCFSFRNNTVCEMRCNNNLIYSFFTNGGESGMDFAMSKAQFLRVALLEHPFDFLNPESEKDRKIWYYGLPATIAIRSDNEKWKIFIIPEYSVKINKETWWKLLIDRRSNVGEEIDTSNDVSNNEIEDDFQDYINYGDAFYATDINWFRK